MGDVGVAGVFPDYEVSRPGEISAQLHPLCRSCACLWPRTAHCVNETGVHMRKLKHVSPHLIRFVLLVYSVLCVHGSIVGVLKHYFFKFYS